MSVQHPSQLQLDQLIASPEACRDVEAHVAGCLKCQVAVSQMRTVYQDFLVRFPSLESLPASAPAPAPRPEPTRDASLWAWLGVPKWRLSFALSGAVAVAAVLLLTVFSGPAPLAENGIRLKGGAIVEMMVARGGGSAPFFGQPVHAGDRLAFRYSTDQRFLLLLSVEASGKISVLLPPDGSESMSILPGRGVRLDDGIELDDYPGPERLLMLLTAAPLKSEEVIAEVTRVISGQSDAARASLELGPLPFDGDQLSWLLKKEAP